MKRYLINWPMEEPYEAADGEWCLAEDAQSELAALREELVNERRRFSDLDDRSDIIFEAACGLLACVENGYYTGHDAKDLSEAIEMFVGRTKPTESGAS